MSREIVNRICAAMQRVGCSDPRGGGHNCWKLGGKIFAITGAVIPADFFNTNSVDTAEMLLKAGGQNARNTCIASWITLPLDSPEDELCHRIEESYRIIQAVLPKKIQAGE